MKNIRHQQKMLVFSMASVLLTIHLCEAQVNDPKTVNAQTALQVENKRVGNCMQPVPVDWISSSNPQGSALDMYDASHTMYAGWGINAVNSRMALFYDRELYNKDPQRSVLRIANMVVLGQFGDKTPVVYTTELNEQIDGFVIRSVASGSVKGVVIYKIYPGDKINYTYIESVRFAFTINEW